MIIAELNDGRPTRNGRKRRPGAARGSAADGCELGPGRWRADYQTSCRAVRPGRGVRKCPPAIEGDSRRDAQRHPQAARRYHRPSSGRMIGAEDLDWNGTPSMPSRRTGTVLAMNGATPLDLAVDGHDGRSRSVQTPTIRMPQERGSSTRSGISQGGGHGWSPPVLNTRSPPTACLGLGKLWARVRGRAIDARGEHAAGGRRSRVAAVPVVAPVPRLIESQALVAGSSCWGDPFGTLRPRMSARGSKGRARRAVESGSYRSGRGGRCREQAG